MKQRFSPAEVSMFTKHALELGLKIEPADDSGLAFLMNPNSTTYSYCFQVDMFSTDIKVNYFVGDKMYTSRMTLDEFESLTTLELTKLQFGARSINQEYTTLKAKMLTLPKQHKNAVESILKG
jgi:hypothetical protein